MTETITIIVQTSTVARMLLLSFLSFLLSMALTPFYTTVAYKYEWWKKQRSDSWSGGKATVYAKLHAAKHKGNIPNMAGIVFVIAISAVTLLLNLERRETWLPLAGMMGAGAIGFIDDWMNIRGSSKIAGMRAKVKFFLHSIVALIGGWWFWAKLDVTSLNFGFGEVALGSLVIILFWFVVIATANAVNITDGLDGLAGGLLVSSFAVYTIIATVQGQYALAGFCLTIVGALLSYT